MVKNNVKLKFVQFLDKMTHGRSQDFLSGSLSFINFWLKNSFSLKFA
jgi:hypothetical protein